MALGTELFNLATSFDPYGAFRKGAMASEMADAEQQKLGLEKQKMVLQKQQLQEQQKELQGEQGKPPELAQMSQNILGPGYTLTDENGMPTVAGQVNDLKIQSKQEIALGQKLIQQSKYMEPGSKEQVSTLAEGRRMLRNGQTYQNEASNIAQKEQNNALYGLATATNQDDWNNVVKAWENNGLPIPKGFPTEYSPENMKKIASMAPLQVQQKISDELRKREEEKRKETREDRAEHREVIKDRKDGLIIQKLTQSLAKGGGGEGGSDSPIKGLPKTKDEREGYIARYQSIKTIDDISSMLNNPKYSKFITPATQFTPQVIANLQQNFPELSQKLARIQAYEFSIGGKALTAQEQKILEPLYGWRGLNAAQLKKRMEGVQQDFTKRNKLEQEMYPGLKTLEKKFDAVYEEPVESSKKPPTTKVPTVTTKEQYDALPDGAIYIEDGKQYQKPKKK
jgi:hypothetical protein